MLVVETIWWLFFWTALGLCIGSFLNVVIYRIPRDQSILDPRWSCCPDCQARIRWYDNLPVISYVLLGGRCRRCRNPISPRYPVIEMLTALVVLVLLDTFFISDRREGLCRGIGLTWRLAEDWPIFVAHVALFACLLAMAAIDLREYWVDIRFTTLATWFGFVLHTLWTPRHSLGTAHNLGWPRPSDATAAGAVGALLGLGVLWLWLRSRRIDYDDSEPQWSGPLHPPGLPTDEWRAPWIPAAPKQTRPARSVFTRRGPGLLVAIVLGGLLFAGLVSMLLEAAGHAPWIAAPWRGPVPAGLIFALILAEGAAPRAADQEIIQAIEAERFGARKMVLEEFVRLLPAILLGALAVWLELSGRLGGRFAGVLHFRAGQSWQPMYGFATAAGGYVIGGASGWAVRIVFTLVFGREAFGLGDIHMMAAAGCVAGWPVVLLGFMVTVFLALGAWLVTLPFKRTRAIPLVPWLALGYVIVVAHYEALLRFGPIRNTVEVVNMLILHNSQAAAPRMAT